MTVCCIFGPIGVDSVNSSNEVVTSIVCCCKEVTITVEADDVADCATVGTEGIFSADSKSKCSTVHYEAGYVTAGISAKDYDFA